MDKKLLSYQLLFDSETNNGLNSEKQQEWNQKIESELKKYEKYKNTEIDCRQFNH